MQLMISLQLIQCVACVLGVTTIILSSSFVGVGGRTIQLNWTSNGVKEYTSTPLNTQLGDVLILECDENISNLFIQTQKIQYDSCNASAGSGVFEYNGICFPNNPIMLTLTENSQDLINTVNFDNNQAYFLTSYSNGRFRRNDEDFEFASGGQCEDGLKMIIIIGESEFLGDGNGGGNPHHGPVGNLTERETGPQLQIIRLLSAIIVPAVSVVIMTLALILIIVIALICKAYRTKKNGIEGSNTSSNVTTLSDDKLKPRYEAGETIYGTPDELQSEPLYDEATNDYTETDIEMQPNILYGRCELPSKSQWSS